MDQSSWQSMPMQGRFRATDAVKDAVKDAHKVRRIPPVRPIQLMTVTIENVDLLGRQPEGY